MSTSIAGSKLVTSWGEPAQRRRTRHARRDRRERCSRTGFGARLRVLSRAENEEPCPGSLGWVLLRQTRQRLDASASAASKCSLARRAAVGSVGSSTSPMPISMTASRIIMTFGVAPTAARAIAVVAVTIKTSTTNCCQCQGVVRRLFSIEGPAFVRPEYVRTLNRRLYLENQRDADLLVGTKTTGRAPRYRESSLVVRMSRSAVGRRNRRSGEAKRRGCPRRFVCSRRRCIAAAGLLPCEIVQGETGGNAFSSPVLMHVGWPNPPALTPPVMS